MNNFMISAKRFFTNKNTVTIIGVVVILVILYSGYQSTVQNAIKPVNVPVAVKMIPPQTLITDSDIKIITIQGRFAEEKVVYLKKEQIIGKYTGVGVTIPQDGLFYRDLLVEKDQLPGSWLTLLKTDPNGVVDVPIYVPINIVTSYGNAIQPGTYIDMYMKAQDESRMIMYGKLLENIEILAVKDGSGNDVFTSVDNKLTPAYLYFGVMNELYILIRKAQYLTTLGVELVVVPHGGVAPVTGDVEVSSEYLRDFIDANTIKIPENTEYLDPDAPPIE